MYRQFILAHFDGLSFSDGVNPFAGDSRRLFLLFFRVLPPFQALCSPL